MQIIKRPGENLTSLEIRAARAQSAFITTPNIEGALHGNVLTAPQNWFSVTGTGDTDWLDVTDYSGIVVQFVTSGTFTLTVLASLDGGTTFVAITPDQGSTVHPLTTGNTVNAAGFYRFTGAYQFMKVNVSAITGTLTAFSAALQASISAPSSTVTGFPATTATAAGTAAAVTATLAAAGVGLFNYVTGIIVVASAIGVAPAAGTFDVVSTGLPTVITIPIGVEATAGRNLAIVPMSFPSPIKGSATNTAVTLAGTAPTSVRLGLTIIGYSGA